MNFNHNHGGNPKGVADCVARALAITLSLPYYEVAQTLAPYTQQGGVNVWATGFLDIMEGYGLRYVQVDTRRKVAELPANCIAHTLNHYTAIVDGCVQDVIDTRLEMVRGYWVRGNRFNVVKGDAVKNSDPLNFSQAMAMRRMLAINYRTYTEISTI